MKLDPFILFRECGKGRPRAAGRVRTTKRPAARANRSRPKMPPPMKVNRAICMTCGTRGHSAAKCPQRIMLHVQHRLGGAYVKPGVPADEAPMPAYVPRERASVAGVRKATSRMFQRAKEIEEEKRVAEGIARARAAGGIAKPSTSAPPGIVVKRKGEKVSLVLPGAAGTSAGEAGKKRKVAASDGDDGGDDDDDEDDGGGGGGLAGLLGAYGSDDEIDEDEKPPAPSPPPAKKRPKPPAQKIDLPGVGDLDLPDWDAMERKQQTATALRREALDRREPCRSFAAGTCRMGDRCKYKHVGPAPAAVDNRALCRNFQNGKCFMGDKCKYRHTTTEEEVIVSANVDNRPGKR